MKGLLKGIARFAEWCGMCLLVAVSLPLAVIAAFLLRGALLIVALVVLIAAGVAYVANPRLRHWTLHDPRPHRPHLHLL